MIILFFALLITYLLALYFHSLVLREGQLIWLSLGVFFYVPVAASLWVPSSYFSEQIFEVLVGAIIFNFVYVALLIGVSWGARWGGGKLNLYSSSAPHGLSYTMFFILLLNALGCAVYSWISFGTVLGGSWWDTRITGWLGLLQIYSFLLSAICIYLLYLEGRYYLFLVALGVAFYIVFLFKARALMLPIVTPFVFHILLVKKRLMLVLFFGALLLFAAVILQNIRYVYGSGVVDPFVIVEKSLRSIVEGSGEFSLIKPFFYSLAHRNELEGYGEGWTFLRIIFFWSPSDLGLKPTDFTYSIWNLYTGERGVGGSLHPTLYGVYHLNFGWLYGLAAIFLIVQQLFIYLLLWAFKLPVYVGWSGMGAGYVLMARGSYYNGFLQALLVVVPIVVLCFLVRKVRVFNVH